MEALFANLMSDDQALKLQAAEKLSRISAAARSAAVPLVLASAGQDDVAELANKALEQMGPPLARDVTVFGGTVSSRFATDRFVECDAVGTPG